MLLAASVSGDGTLSLSLLLLLLLLTLLLLGGAPIVRAVPIKDQLLRSSLSLARSSVALAAHLLTKTIHQQHQHRLRPQPDVYIAPARVEISRAFLGFTGPLCQPCHPTAPRLYRARATPQRQQKV